MLTFISPERRLRHSRRLGVFVVLVAIAFASPVRAQVQTVLFSTSGAGATAAITNWGIGVVGGSDIINRALIFMGSNNIDEVNLPFTLMDPLTNGQLSAASQTEIAGNLALASLAGNKPLIIGSGTGDGVNAWYVTGANQVDPNRWASNLIATQKFINRPIKYAMPFNEPDYAPWNQGSQQNLDDIMGLLLSSTNFSSTQLGGGTTLDDDNAISWYDFVASRAALGTTHCLAGSVSGYVGFIQNVLAHGGMPFNPEVHNLVETIIGANYGLQGAIWWFAPELARGNFVNACQGKQLGYAENWPNWTAAAVYRGTNGAVQAFLGGSERMAVTTTYRFFSQDRDVFYNGYGPQRDFTVTVPGGSGYQVNQPDMEQVVNVTWGSDVPPPIGGRYIVANRYSQKVLEVPNASTNNGVFLEQTTYTGASNQLWDIYPIPATFGGDISYYTLVAVHDGVTADDYNWSYANGNPIDQWNGGTNALEQWFFQYAGNGYFNIRSRWSGDYLDISGPSTASGAGIVQWSGLGRTSQQWRLIPVGAAVEFVVPATPTGVTASAGAASVTVNWTPNPGTTSLSYNVLRATNAGGPFELCARALTNNAFTDKEANQPQPYYYVVQAVDGSLNTSANSVQVSATPTGVPALVGVYHLDGNLGDSSGNSNNATMTGLQAYGPGVSGAAIKLDGLTNFIEMPAEMLNFTNFTIAAWVYWNGGAAWQRIFDFGNGTGQYLFLTPDSGNGTLRFAITTNGPGGEQWVETAQPMASNQWVHVAVTGAGNTVSLYTNGLLAATSGSLTVNPADFNPVLNFLGQSQYSGDPLFSGWLDEVYVANYAMSGAQIAALAVNPAPLPTLVHCYHFNETSGTIVHDSTGGAAGNGTLPNGGTFSGGRLALSAASSQYVQLPAGLLSNYTAVTIEAWVTFPDQIAWNTMLFAFGTTSGTSGENYIFCAPQGGRIAITSTNYTGEQNAYSGMDFSFHTNFHVTAVFDPPAKCLQLFTNGVLAGVNNGVTVPLNAVSNLFSFLGRSLYSGDAYFDFSLDEFRIYNGAMQPADIATAQLLGPNVLLTTNVSLSTASGGGTLTLNWPLPGSGLTLESSPSLGAEAVWTPVPMLPSLVGTNNQVTVVATNAIMFFRLQR